MINDEISKNLIQQKDSNFALLEPYLQKKKFLSKIYSKFLKFDFEGFQKEIGTEIKANIKEWWTNTEKGIIKDEELQAILFEYNSTWWADREAVSYGIHKWKDFDIYTNDFDMGYSYSFTTEFYAAPGITVSYFDCFGFLDDDSNLKKKHRKGKYLDKNGFHELVEYINVFGILKIHEVFKKLHQKQLFESINMSDKFMFMIGANDMEKFPLLIVEKQG